MGRNCLLQTTWGSELRCLGSAGATKLGHTVGEAPFFDTVRINVGDAAAVVSAALAEGINLRQLDASTVTIALDETTKASDVDQLFRILDTKGVYSPQGQATPDFSATSLAPEVRSLLCALPSTVA